MTCCYLARNFSEKHDQDLWMPKVSPNLKYCYTSVLLHILLNLGRGKLTFINTIIPICVSLTEIEVSKEEVVKPFENRSSGKLPGLKGNSIHLRLWE